MAGFTIEEARAGHALAQQDVARAQSALSAAQGRRERRDAQARFDHAQSILSASTTALESVAKQLGVGPHAPTIPPPSAVPPRTPQAAVGARYADAMLLSDVLHTVRTFGERRRLDGDVFTESRYLGGTFFYETGAAKTGIRVWGDETDWVISIFSAARVGLRPSLGLYQFVSRWRTTNGIGGPYVVEDGGIAAIMCERTFQSSQLASDTTAWRMITSTIDLIGESSQAIARWLCNSEDGIPFTATDEVGLTLMLGWWEVSDAHIAQAH